MRERSVIGGWGQITQRRDAAPPFQDPEDRMEAASREAGALAGKALWALVDTVLVVRPISRSLVPPGTALSGRLGLKPARVRVSGSGGETPQHRVNQAAGMLTPGKLAGQGFRYSARAAQVAR